MKTYECNICGARYSISMEGRAFTYAGRAYVISGDVISRVGVTGMEGRPCSVCAGFALDAVRANGITYRGWCVYPNGLRVFWARGWESRILFTWVENIYPSTRDGRIPIPRLTSAGWCVRSGGDRITLDSYGAWDFSPWPRDWESMPNFPVMWAGVGIRTRDVFRNRSGDFMCHGRKFRYSEFPWRYSRFQGIPEETWAFLESNGYRYAVCREGVVSVPDRQLV